MWITASLLHLVWRDWLAYPVRGLLMAGCIGVNVVIMVAMISMLQGMRREGVNQLSSWGTSCLVVREKAGQPGHASARQEAERFEELKGQIPGLESVTCVSHLNWASSRCHLPEGLHLAEVSPAYFDLRGVHPLAGRRLTLLDQKFKHPVCVLGAEAARRLGRQGVLGAGLIIGNLVVEVVGILEPSQKRDKSLVLLSLLQDNRGVYLPFGLGKWLALGPHEDAGVQEAYLHFYSPAASLQALPMVQRWLEREVGRQGNYEVVHPVDLLKGYHRLKRLMEWASAAGAGLTLISLALGVMGFMRAITEERKKEIGLERALGGSYLQVVGKLALYVVALATIGGTAGALMGCLLGRWGSSLLGYPSGVSVEVVLAGIGISVLAALMGAGYPVCRAVVTYPWNILKTG